MSNVENVCPQVLRGVARELRRLAADPPPGVKLQLRDDELTDVRACIEGPADTPYAGGVFRVRLVLPRDFPAAAPRAFFLTKLFHPNVAADSGEVCVNTLRREWRPELGLRHVLLALRCLLIVCVCVQVCVNTLRREWRPELGLRHVLLALRCLLIEPNADSALNAEAAALLRDRYQDYFTRAKLLTDIHARPSRDEDAGPCAKRERRATEVEAGPAAGGGAAGAGGGAAGAGGGAGAPARDRRRILKRL